jgi:hypothetical protein
MPPYQGGRKVTDESDARGLLEAVGASGKPLSTWCRENGINACSLYVWRAKVHDRDVHGSAVARPLPLPRLVEVQVPLGAAAGSDRYEVVLPNDLVVRVGGDFDVGVLRRLVEAVRSC